MRRTTHAARNAEIEAAYAAQEPTATIAGRFGVSPRQICAILERAAKTGRISRPVRRRRSKAARPVLFREDVVGVCDLPLSGGRTAQIDSALFAWASQWNWTADKRRTGQIYASRTISLPDGRNGTVRLHRALTDAPAGMDVDHIDGNTLNNTLSNLRICTRAQNAHNSRVRTANATGYKGVSRSSHGNSWYAQISAHGEYRHLGHFSSPEAAAVAFDTAAIALQGEFAHLNFSRDRDWIVPQDLRRALKETSEFQPIAPQDRRGAND